MSLINIDPGPCPVDDLPHTACVSADAALAVVVQLPNRDGVVDVLVAPAPVNMQQQAIAAVVNPPADAPLFTTATYRRDRHVARRR